MEKYFKRKAPELDSSINPRNLCVEDINWEEEIKYDPGLRKQIDSYHPNQREKVRRKYLENGPCQPRTCNFHVSYIGDKPRRFIPKWFDELEVGLSIVSPRVEHTAFIVFCLEKRKMQDMKHLLLMVGMVITGKIGYDYMLVMLVACTLLQ